MIKSVQKATNILEVLADGCGKPVSLAELSHKTEINKSTCSHIINTLSAEGYVVKVSSSKGYVLGPAAYCLSRYGRYKNDLIMICRPIMQYLHKNTGYSIVLAVVEGSMKYIIDYIDDGTIFKTKAKILEDDIYRTATGRAILTNLSDTKIFDVYKKHGNPTAEQWTTISSFQELMEEIAKTKNQEIIKSRMVNNESKIVDLGYAAAIFNNIQCVGAIGIAVEISLEEESCFEKEDIKIRKILQKGAKEITRRLSYK